MTKPSALPAMIRRLLPVGMAVVLAGIGVLVIAERLGQSPAVPPAVPPALSIGSPGSVPDAGTNQATTSPDAR